MSYRTARPNSHVLLITLLIVAGLVALRLAPANVSGAVIDAALAVAIPVGLAVFAALFVYMPARIFSRDPELRSNFAATIRRHPLAYAASAAGLLLTLLGALPYGAADPALLGLGAFYVGLVGFLWLVWLWGLSNNVAPVGIGAMVRRYPHLMLALALGGAGLLLAAIVWVAPWTGPVAFRMVAQPALIVVFLLLFAMTQSTMARGTPAGDPSRAAAIAFICVAVAAVQVTLASLGCQVADCGGAILRTATPATWTEQVAFARAEVNHIDPAATLLYVTASPQDHAISHTAYPVLFMRFVYLSGDQYINISYEDNALDWKSDTFVQTLDTHDALFLAQDGFSGQNSALDLVKLSPADVVRLTWDEGQEFIPDGSQRPVVSFFTPRDIAVPENLPVSSGALWRVTYRGDLSGPGAVLLSIWIDAATGAVLARETY